jgi:prephenate dehydrogenase
MTETQATVAVIGAGGKMGQRISNNLARSDYRILYAENSPKGQEYITGLGRELIESHEAASQADVVILAVPDILLGKISADIVPAMKPGAILLTLDPPPPTPTTCSTSATVCQRRGASVSSVGVP